MFEHGQIILGGKGTREEKISVDYFLTLPQSKSLTAKLFFQLLSQEWPPAIVIQGFFPANDHDHSIEIRSPLFIQNPECLVLKIQGEENNPFTSTELAVALKVVSVREEVLKIFAKQTQELEEEKARLENMLANFEKNKIELWVETVIYILLGKVKDLGSLKTRIYTFNGDEETFTFVYFEDTRSNHVYIARVDSFDSVSNITFRKSSDWGNYTWFITNIRDGRACNKHEQKLISDLYEKGELV